MPNTLITPTLISRQALGFWQESQILTGLFNRSYTSEFGGGRGVLPGARRHRAVLGALRRRERGWCSCWGAGSSCS